MIPLLFAIPGRAQNDSIPLTSSDSCIRIYAQQMERLTNTYFGRDVITQMKTRKKTVFFSLTPSLKDTFGIEVFHRNNDTLFSKAELAGLREYIQKNGSFSYCFYVDGCSGINEPVERLPPEEEQKIKKKNLQEYKTRMRKRYGQPVKFYFNVPYNTLKK